MNRHIRRILFSISLRGLFITISKLIAFITIPLITRALGPSVFGEYNFLLTLGSYATLPSNWGFLAKGIREIASSKNYKEKSQVISSILSARIVISILFALVFMTVTGIIKDSKYVYLLFLALLHHGIITTYIDFYFYGIKNVWIPSIAHFISQLIYAGLVIIIIKTPGDLDKLLLLMVLMVCVESGILIFFSRKEINIKLNFSFINAYKQFKENFKLGVGLKISQIQNSYPVLLIPLFLSNEILGNYSAVYKLYTLTSVVMQMVILAVAPYIIKSKEIGERKRNYYIKTFLALALLFGLLMALVVFIFNGLIINILFGKEYHLSYLYLKWYSISILSVTPLTIALSSLMNYYSLDHRFMIGGIIQTLLILVLTPICLYFSSIPFLILSLGLSMIVVIMYYLWSLNKEFRFIIKPSKT